MDEKPDEDIHEPARKLKRASQMLFIRRHRVPGVKGWELKKALGRNYMKIIEYLNDELDDLGMEVKIVQEDVEDVNHARFVVRLKSSEHVEGTSGLRIDDLAALAVCLSFITSRQGKVSRNEIEELLRSKFPKWKVDMNIDRYIRKGYLAQDKEDMLYIGWRTRAEIDQKTMMELVLS